MLVICNNSFYTRCELNKVKKYTFYDEIVYIWFHPIVKEKKKLLIMLIHKINNLLKTKCQMDKILICKPQLL